MKNKYTILIADDEPLAVDVLQYFIGTYDEFETVDVAKDGLQAVDMINKYKPDLVFLDVQMPGFNGFDVMSNISGDHSPGIIFTTAFDHYALKAFEVNAVDYLLKPFDRDRFQQAINKFLNKDSSKMNSSILHMLHSLNKTKPEMLTRILVKERQKLLYVKTAGILYFEADGDYVRIITEDKKYMLNNSLNNLEGHLDPNHFARIHRSFIVNLDYIKEFIPYVNGEYIILLHNNVKLKLTRSYKKNIKIQL